jgi:hypothetical protein
MEWVSSKEEAKDAIRKGGLIDGNRQIGKTEALMEVIHEDHHGDVILTGARMELMESFVTRYRERFPEDKLPTIQPPRTAGMGDPRQVYADVYSLLNDADKERLVGTLTAAIW